MAEEPEAPRGADAAALGVAGVEQAVVVGRGMSGVVWRGYQPQFDRWVAVKVIDTRLSDMAAVRFERECRAVGALSGHPHIVPVHDAGLTADSRPYLMMPFYADGSLADRLLAAGRLPWPTVLDLGVKLAAALQAAHEAGVLHRDVKPENVLLTRYGEPQLADFGLARVGEAMLTRTATVMATPVHAAPEVLSGVPASPASDVYSLGSSLYRLLAGQPAFHQPTDETLLPLLTRIATEPVPQLGDGDAPEPVAQLIVRSMAKDPSQRPPTALAFAREIQAVQRRLGVRVTPMPGDPTDAWLAATGTAPVPPDLQLTSSLPASAPAVTATGRLPAPPSGPPSTAGPTTGRHRRAVTLVASGVAAVLVAVVVVLLLAARGGSGLHVSAQQRDADRRTARAVLPQITDLPAGYMETGRTEDPTRAELRASFASCLGVPDSTSRQTAHELSDLFVGSSGEPAVVAQADVLASESDVASDINAAVTPQYLSCSQQVIAPAIPSAIPSAQPSPEAVASATRLDVSSYLHGSVAGTGVRVTTQVLDSQGSGSDVVLDRFFFTNGRIELMVDIVAGSTPDPSLESGVLTAVTSRLQKSSG